MKKIQKNDYNVIFSFNFDTISESGAFAKVLAKSYPHGIFAVPHGTNPKTAKSFGFFIAVRAYHRHTPEEIASVVWDDFFDTIAKNCAKANISLSTVQSVYTDHICFVMHTISHRTVSVDLACYFNFNNLEYLKKDFLIAL